jgi:hypothetical protein
MILKKLYFLLFLFENYLSQGPRISKNITLDIEETGQISQDNGLFYYQLLIHQINENDDINLVMRIKENDLADEGKDDFSDPDIYVSKVNIP